MNSASARNATHLGSAGRSTRCTSCVSSAVFSQRSPESGSQADTATLTANRIRLAKAVFAVGTLNFFACWRPMIESPRLVVPTTQVAPQGKVELPPSPPSACIQLGSSSFAVFSILQRQTHTHTSGILQLSGRGGSLDRLAADFQTLLGWQHASDCSLLAIS
jgi:hypothetical protein